MHACMCVCMYLLLNQEPKASEQVCTYVSGVYVCISAPMCVCVYACRRVCEPKHIRMNTHAHIYAWIHTHTHICMNTHTHIYAWIHTHTYMHEYTRAHIYAWIHTHTYTGEREREREERETRTQIHTDSHASSSFSQEISRYWSNWFYINIFITIKL